MNKTAKLYVSLLIATLVWVGASAPVWAEEAVREVKPNDTLGAIIAEQYPDYKNRAPIMQEVLKLNPGAFIKNDINRLVVGKTLKLPNAADIPDLLPSEPVSSGSDPAVLEKLKKVEAENAELKDTIALMEEENASLQEMVKQYAEQKQPSVTPLNQLKAEKGEVAVEESPMGQPAKMGGQEPSTTTAGAETAPMASADSPLGEAIAGEAGTEKLAELQQSVENLQAEQSALQTELDTAHKEVDAGKREITALNDQLTGLQRANDKLSGDLQAVQTDASLGSRLPWVLVALLAFLMLPLLWLLMRRRSESAAAAGAQLVSAGVSTTPPSAQAPSVLTGDVADVPGKVAEDIAVGDFPENPEADFKLDIARAYLDLRDSVSASEILQEVLGEGGNRQRQEAKEILSFIV